MIIDINEENIDKFGLFCRQTKRNSEGNKFKENWVKERFKEGMKVKILKIKEGKKDAFRGTIEYIPGKYAWRGIEADGWMVIHCLWVVGRAKEKGYGSKLLKKALDDAKDQDMYGVAAVTAKKGGSMPKPALFLKRGFEKVDESPPYFELYVKKLKEDAPLPKFVKINKKTLDSYEGITIIDSGQCPYTYDLNHQIKEMAKEKNVPVKVVDLKSPQDVKEKSASPYGTFCVVYNGQVISHKPEAIKQIKKRFDALVS
jgi:hypothetical protein